MNFNFSQQPEYSLNSSLTHEVINLYGVLTKFLVVQKINNDDIVFGDYSHIKTDNSKIFDVYMMPENSDEFDSSGYNFSGFGLVNLDSINLFVSRMSVENIFGSNIDLTNGIGGIIGNLIILPNNKIMEITDVEFMTPGVNNLFSYKDAKSAYKLTCKTYNNKLIQELNNSDISVSKDDNEEVIPYETLDNYFNELIGEKTEQDNEAQNVNQVNTVIRTGNVDIKVSKPIIDRSEEDVFGAFS